MGRMCIYVCDLTNKKCGKRASFNNINEAHAIFCKNHKHDGMVNVNCKKCIMCKNKQPSYGYEGKRAIYCASCAKDTGDDKLVDVVSNLCKYEGEKCRKNATYGFVGYKAVRCQPHAEEFMVDVKNTMCDICMELGVRKQATFGYENAIRCIEHKNDDMIDIKHKNAMCNICNNTRATYGYEGETATRCIKCIEENMKDLSSRMCDKCGEIQAVFGYDKDELFCGRCKKDDMKNVKAKMCCICGEHQPTFDYPTSDKAKYCKNCADIDMIDIVNPRCNSCGIFIVINAHKLCACCNPNAYVKEKELLVVDYIRNKGYKFIHNKSIYGSKCSYRPDIRIIMNNFSVIIEIDEFQHSGYSTVDEISRMLVLKQSIGHNCIFIRYNPDNFYIKGKIREIHTEDRLVILNQILDKYISTPCVNELIVIYLFYNNDNDEYINVKYL